MKRLIYIVIAVTLTLATASADNPFAGRDKVSLELEKVPIVDVLNMLARQFDLNLVLSGQVDGTVSIRLQDVDIATALDAILTANGYNYYLANDVVIVKPIDEESVSELDSRMITLHYLAPVTVKKALEPRLSPKGKIVILDRTKAGKDGKKELYQPNSILITDYANMLDKLEALVHQMDRPEKTVLIEAKVIETTMDASTALGFQWPSQVGFRMDGANSASNTGIGTGTNGTSNTTTSTVLNSATDAGVWDIEGDKWVWGRLSVEQLRVVLNLLEKEGNSRLVSDPRISTTENHEAVIKVTTVIPIQTINRFTEGASSSDIVTFEDEEVGLSLTVTPRINEGNTITLDVYPVIEDIIGFNGPPDNQKPITSSRSVRTRITLKSGETAALGGLLKENDIESVQRVPLLGHIPILGKALFTSSSKQHKTNDL
ncbi:MAG: hypothetical protein D6800_14260, partial [Candidatus Zixiibacteriota bacterium]